MKRIPLAKVIDDHFNANMNMWLKKVDIFVLANEYGYSPETTCPLLRKMEREGIIIKRKYQGKYANNLIQYLKGTPPEVKKTRYVEVELNGERIMQEVLV